MQATLSPQEFTDWFGSSQAVDTLGQPLVLYHGTDAQFEQFNTSYIGQSQEGKLFAGRGFYFSDNKADARAYGANVLSVHLRIQKTLDLRDKSEFLKAFADLVPRNQVKTLAQLVHDYSEAKAALKIDDVMVKEESHRPGFYDVQWKIAGEWQSSWPRTPSSLELSDDMTGRRYAERHALPPDPGQFLNTAAFSYADITKAILENGYDGAINDASIGTCGDEYVVFSSGQIMILPTVTHQNVYLYGGEQAVNSQHGADSPLAQFGVAELHEQLVEVSRKLTWPSTDDRQYLKELHATKFELLLELVSRQPDSRPVEEVLALGRMAKLSSLKDKAGVSYTFYCLAQQAIDQAGGDLFKVDWTQVEDSTILTSVGKNNQRPKQVHEALCQISPGATRASRQEAILRASLASFENTRNPEGKVSTNQEFLTP